MELMETLRLSISQGLTEYARLTPLVVLGGIVAAGLIVHLINRSKDALLLAATAALYALPFISVLIKH